MDKGGQPVPKTDPLPSPMICYCKRKEKEKRKKLRQEQEGTFDLLSRGTMGEEN